MTFYEKDTIELVKIQISEHRKSEARQNTLTAEERLNSILDESNPSNSTFPWLCADFVTKLVGVETDSVIPPGILNVVYLYKLMEELSTGHGFRTFLGVMRRNDLWCNIRSYTFGETKNSSDLAHKEAQVLGMIAESNFFDTLITCFKTLVGFYIVTDHVKSTPLHNFIKCQERFNDDELRFYAEELVCAVDFLHSKGIIHRSLTAANIKLTAEGHIKVFNLQNAYLALDDEGRRIERPRVEGIVGIDAYFPPEIVDNKLYGYEVDWWHLGVVLYFMMSGKMPFQGNTKRELHRNIKFSVPVFQEGLHNSVTHDLIKSFLEKKPCKRLGNMGSSQVYSHKYFQGTHWPRVLSGQNHPPFLPATSAVTSLPSGLCMSLDHLMETEPIAKNKSRLDLKRKEMEGIVPDQFLEFELEHDWTTYLHPEVPIEAAIHYVHGELKPPAVEEDVLTLEELITKPPEPTPDEIKLLIEYADLPKGLQVPLTKKMANDMFAMLTPAAAVYYESDPEGFCCDLVEKQSYLNERYGPVEASDNSGNLWQLDSSHLLRPVDGDQETESSTASKVRLGSKIKDTMMLLTKPMQMLSMTPSNRLSKLSFVSQDLRSDDH